jgi:hypothetical protein
MLWTVSLFTLPYHLCHILHIDLFLYKYGTVNKAWLVYRATHNPPKWHNMITHNNRHTCTHTHRMQTLLCMKTHILTKMTERRSV